MFKSIKKQIYIKSGNYTTAQLSKKLDELKSMPQIILDNNRVKINTVQVARLDYEAITCDLNTLSEDMALALGSKANTKFRMDKDKTGYYIQFHTFHNKFLVIADKYNPNLKTFEDIDKAKLGADMLNSLIELDYKIFGFIQKRKA